VNLSSLARLICVSHYGQPALVLVLPWDPTSPVLWFVKIMFSRDPDYIRGGAERFPLSASWLPKQVDIAAISFNDIGYDASLASYQRRLISAIKAFSRLSQGFVTGGFFQPSSLITLCDTTSMRCSLGQPLQVVYYTRFGLSNRNFVHRQKTLTAAAQFVNCGYP